jgi:prophage antirepressor-like protein
MTKLARYLFGDEMAEAISTRTIDGDSWYMAADICGLLGIANHSQAVRTHLDGDEWRFEVIYTGLAKRRVLMISDSGMLKLIICGRSERAEQIRTIAKRAPAYLRSVPWPAELNE